MSKPMPTTASLFAHSLAETTFVVVDLETTGLKAADSQIIEIGAVKVRGGEVLDTFSTFVDPGTEIPSFITELTGITDQDLTGAPQIGTVLPDFLSFAENTVWVAHNASFDLNFLNSVCAELALAWPCPAVIDTLALARKTLRRKDVGSYRLSSLARFVGATTTPTHRALDDALATVDVLHFLIEKLGSYDIENIHELATFEPKVPPEIRVKRALIADAPHKPGVYVFRAGNGDPLYIGTATNLHRRLSQYFNGTDSRVKITQMVRLAESVETIECAHAMAAEVREARLIAKWRPPYNRQRREPTRGWYLTQGEKPTQARISRVPAGPNSLGPFQKKQTAQSIREMLLDPGSVDRKEPQQAKAADFGVRLAETIASGESQIEALLQEMTEKAAAHRFKRAALIRDTAAELVFTLDKQQRLSTLANIEQLEAAFPDGQGGWHLALIRYGRLAASGTAPRGTNSAHILQLLNESAETVIPTEDIYRGASLDELAIIWKWLFRPEVRIGPIATTSNEAGLCSTLHGAGRFRSWAIDAKNATHS